MDFSLLRSRGEIITFRQRICTFFVVPLWLTFISTGVAVQEPRIEQQPLAPSDTSSPQATFASFLDACNELHELILARAESDKSHPDVLRTVERVLDCLDLSELPRELRGTAGVESAVFLKEVLDRIDLPSDDDFPTDGFADRPSQQPFHWKIPGTRIALRRSDSGPQAGEILFSPETVRRAAEFYRIAKAIPYRDGGRSISPGFYESYLEATKKTPTLSSDTSSPRGTLTRFLDACNELHGAIHQERHLDRSNTELIAIAEKALSCLDTSQLPDYSKEYFDREAAICLKEILDRLPLPPAEEIPGIEVVEGSAAAEPLIRWQIPGSQITISRVAEGPRRGEFLFSAGTVIRAPELFANLQERPYRSDGRPVSKGLYDWWLSSPGNPLVARIVGVLPGRVRIRIWGAAIWQWIGLVAAIPIAIFSMFLVSRVGKLRGEVMQQRSLFRFWVSLLFPLITMLIPLAFKHFLWVYLTLRGTVFYVASFAADVVFLLGLMGLVIGASSRIAETIIVLRKSKNSQLDANVIRIVFRVLGIIAAAIVFLEGGRYLGFPITTLVASAGIGGLALALSAQNAVKGMFGTLTILLDKPYRVGDRIIACGYDGIVEEIGLRSTKIRGFLTDHMISVPNSEMAEAEIENVGKREYIRRMTDLHIPLDTSKEDLAKALEAVRRVLDNHDGMNADFPPRVFFNDFNSDSFNIRILCWFFPPNIWDYYAFCERLNLDICQAFEEQGIQFSLPMRHSYWKKDNKQGPLEVTMINQQVQKNDDEAG